MNIGISIKKLRTKNGMTQQQLAEYIGVSMQTISRWETSVTYPDVVVLPVLARFFHVTVDCLLYIEENSMKTIESSRMLVREWRESDASDLFDLKQYSDSFMEYLKFRTMDDSLDSIKIWREYREMYPLVLKETGKLIGVAGLVDIGRYKGYRELEIHICSQYNDVDHVTEAHQLLLDYGFADLGIHVAFAYCGCGEEVMKQAMLNTGFVYEGTLRKFGRDMSDRMRYSITKDEYRPMQD